MHVLLIGASGKIGTAVATALASRHRVTTAGRNSGDHRVDLTDKASIERMFGGLSPVDAVVATPGHAVYKPLRGLTDVDLDASIRDKLLSQVTLTRVALAYLPAGASITLSGGTYSREPSTSSAAIALCNAALEGFTIAAALDLPNGPRINVITPPIVGDLRVEAGHVIAMPPADVALAYLAAVEGSDTGKVIDARPFARLNQRG